MTRDSPIASTATANAMKALAADATIADPAIWICRLPDQDILARAAELDADGPHGRPLWGMTVAIKDNIDVAGLPTTAGCPDFAYTPDTSATAVTRLLDAGAIIVGKTNLDQFATGLVGVRSPYGIPRNVFNAAYVPGGSSSGSAVAVAAGIVDVALGTDTAGSGRVPAAFGNIVGLKPTIGSIPSTGMVPACRSVDTISVFANTVDAALAVLRVIAGYDVSDPYSRPATPQSLRRTALPATLRLATADIDALCTKDVARLYHRATTLFSTQVVDISAYLGIARLLYDGPWVAERTAALRETVTARPEIMHPITRAIVAGGFERKTVDAFDAFHALAKLRQQAAALFTKFDALLLPTAPFCPTLIEVAADPIGPNARLGTFTNFVNLCDLAAIAVPAGHGADGMPVGITVLGPAWSEGRIAAIADHIHRSFTAGLPPPAPAHPLAPGETALFCIGTHMSGLPLNSQLTTLGGRFLRIASTQPEYRLHALENRPGMVRSPHGAAIAGEVWAIPTVSIGALLAQVPPPLGFGTVALTDGPCLGFLAEAHALADAPDITAHGGWRAWLATHRTGT